MVLDEEGKSLLNKGFLTNRQRPDEVLAPLQGAKILIELCTQSEWIARWLEEKGFTVVVGDPNYQLMYAAGHRNVKMDARDARTLAEACRLGLYRPAHRSSEQSRQWREMLEARENVVRIRTQCVNEVRARLAWHGIAMKS